MKCVSLVFCAALVAPVLLLGSAAEAQVWRCMDEPGEANCQEALINDIEDITVRDWPNPLAVSMPSIPYSCERIGGPTAKSVSGSLAGVSWTVRFGGPVSSFLIGRHTASVDLVGTVQVNGTGITSASWPSTTAHYVFQEGTTEVPSPFGSTGVVDLGPVSLATLTGGFWSASLRISIDPNQLATPQAVSHQEDPGFIAWRCTFGWSGRTATAVGSTFVSVNYPVAWTGVESSIAEAVRNQFRRAVRLAVTGVP